MVVVEAALSVHQHLGGAFKASLFIKNDTVCGDVPACSADTNVVADGKIFLEQFAKKLESWEVGEGNT